MSGISIYEAKYVKHLEDATIQNHAQSFPEEMREPFIWFARYVRNECKKNIDVLVRKVEKLGYKTTAGTYAKILQGRWNKDSDGKPTPPILALNNFLEQVEDLQEQDRLEKMAGKISFIETETYLDIASYIDIRRAPDTVCKFGLILGPTGGQKTESFKYYAQKIGPALVTHVEAPDTPTMTKFITDLAEKFGVARTSTHHLKVQRIRDNVTALHCLIIDNVQRLYKPNKGWNQPIFNYLQKLQDETGCTVILCAVTDFKNTIMTGEAGGYFEQFEGRCGGADEFLIMPEWATRGELIQIAEAFGLRPTKQTIALMQEQSRKRGRIRILFNKLQKALRMAENDGQKISFEYLQAACLKPEPKEDGLEEAA